MAETYRDRSLFDPVNEHAVIAIFDTRYRIFAYNLVGVGSLNECLVGMHEVHPR